MRYTFNPPPLFKPPLWGLEWERSSLPLKLKGGGTMKGILKIWFKDKDGLVFSGSVENVEKEGENFWWDDKIWNSGRPAKMCGLETTLS